MSRKKPLVHADTDTQMGQRWSRGGAYHQEVKRLLFLLCLVASLGSHVHAVAQSANVSSSAVVRTDNAKRMQACTTCHGAGVTATVGRTANEMYLPRIAGKPAGYLYNQLLNFREGRRHYGLMVGLVEHLNDAALMEMAQYFSQLQLPYPDAQAPPPGTSAASLRRGQQLVTQGDTALGLPSCTSCHGANMLGVSPAIPGLLGLPRDYLAGQLGAWQTRSRRAQSPDCMAQVAKKLTPEDVSAVTTWLAAQPVPVNAKAAPSIASLPAPLPIVCGGLS